ncbi:MAG: hypothetical protein IKL52_05905 [Candidatus Gastranaerophilales bacterium]|nr:hypothetical protein [Candidatus Gastranaerophilales bacterium]
MGSYVNPSNPTGNYRINDYRFLAERLDSMEASYAQGDIDTASIFRTEMAQEIVGMYADNGSIIELEDAYALVDYQYTFMSDGVTVEGAILKANLHNEIEEIKNNDELTPFEKTGQIVAVTVEHTVESVSDKAGEINENQGEENETASSGKPAYQNLANLEYTSSLGVMPEYENQVSSEFKIKDYTFMADELEEMHEEYNDGNEDDAEEIEDELVDEIQSIYSENGSSISESEAKAIIKEQYLIINGMTIDNAEAICREIAEQENQEDDDEEEESTRSAGDDTTNTEFDQSALYLYGVTTGDNTNNNYSGYNPHNSFQSMTYGYGSTYNR